MFAQARVSTGAQGLQCLGWERTGRGMVPTGMQSISPPSSPKSITGGPAEVTDDGEALPSPLPMPLISGGEGTFRPSLAPAMGIGAVVVPAMGSGAVPGDRGLVGEGGSARGGLWKVGSPPWRTSGVPPLPGPCCCGGPCRAMRGTRIASGVVGSANAAVTNVTN